MHSATDTIEIKATPEQTWQVLSNLRRLPEWYVPAQRIKILTTGPVREDWQFVLGVKTLSGLVLDALGTVKEFDPENRAITWRGQATGISGDSRWQVVATENGFARINHTFQGQGWLMFLSHTLGRNRMTVRKRLENLKWLVERDTSPMV
ncbi:MAG: SRPBCC family protein [Anaerolineae bacterium]|nr:SRPBCC family protein [Anaerolineae bacterium]